MKTTTIFLLLFPFILMVSYCHNDSETLTEEEEVRNCQCPMKRIKAQIEEKTETTNKKIAAKIQVEINTTIDNWIARIINANINLKGVGEYKDSLQTIAKQETNYSQDFFQRYTTLHTCYCQQYYLKCMQNPSRERDSSFFAYAGEIFEKCWKGFRQTLPEATQSSDAHVINESEENRETKNDSLSTPTKSPKPVSEPPAEKKQRWLIINAPKNAAIFLNGQQVGTTTLSIMVEEGMHQIAIQQGEYRWEQVRTINKDTSFINITTTELKSAIKN